MAWFKILDYLELYRKLISNWKHHPGWSFCLALHGSPLLLAPSFSRRTAWPRIRMLHLVAYAPDDLTWKSKPSFGLFPSQPLFVFTASNVLNLLHTTRVRLWVCGPNELLLYLFDFNDSKCRLCIYVQSDYLTDRSLQLGHYMYWIFCWKRASKWGLFDITYTLSKSSSILNLILPIVNSL